MHTHDFSERDWPFDDPVNVAAITTRYVLDRTLPVLLVTHDDDDGGWQVLCGTTSDPDDGRVVCLGCLFSIDRSIGALANLPYGWRAWRDEPTSPWRREPSPPDAEA